MTSKPKSFRLKEEDISKLTYIHNHYKQQFYNHSTNHLTSNLFSWSEAQTIAVIIREKYHQLKNDNDVD